MEKSYQTRAEVPVEETWDLSLLYPTEEAMYADLETLKAMTARLKETYAGHLTTPEAVCACLKDYCEACILVYNISSYVDLAVEVDFCDSYNADRASRVGSTIAALSAELSFIDSEITRQSDAVLNAALEQAGPCAGYLKNLIRSKPHLLHPEAERVLAALSPVTGAPYDIYNSIKMADMRFDDFEADGKTWQLGYSLFEDNYEYEENTAVRRAAFEAFSAKLRQYENSTASAYNAYVQHEKLTADLRGYASIFEKDLFESHVPIPLYHRQIDVIMEKLAPHMQKYARLLQHIHGLDKMTYADLKLPLDPGYCPPVTIQESRKYVENGLSIMGEDYVSMIREAYENRWIDFAKNEGKSTGGFCETPYGKNSFILLSWNGKMSDVFTIAHELGHAGHFKLCNEAQSLFDTNVSGYFVESPSTMNELIMAHYLLKTSDDKRFRRWVLANIVSNTYYHNFVTHLLEAAFQREVYYIADQGGSVQADKLDELMRGVLEKFWGDAVEIIPGSELTWMRQPHYYMGLYSYTYSAGLTIATEMCKRIETEGQPAVDDWKKILTSGSTLDPVGLAALGGIDITTDAPLLDTIDTIGGYIDEICALTEELEKENR